jgi:hypothetical protein
MNHDQFSDRVGGPLGLNEHLNIGFGLVQAGVFGIRRKIQLARPEVTEDGDKVWISN